MSRKNLLLALAIISTTASVTSAFLTASIALDFKGRLRYWIYEKRWPWSSMGHHCQCGEHQLETTSAARETLLS